MAASAHIVCVDLDTFFVSVERLLDPSLVGRPVVVGGRPGSRGVVTSASYEVRRFGVRSGMPLAEAARRAPDAVFVPTRHDVYGEHARAVRAVIEARCPVVQVASIDEFFLDYAGCEGLYRRPGDADDDATLLRAVRELRVAIQRETGLPASAGMGATRAVAKIGSGLAKPAGVRQVRGGEELAFVDELPVRKFPGIGPAAERRLVDGGIHTLGELLRSDAFPELAESVRRGLDGGRATRLGADRPAFREHDTPGGDGSISNEHTFWADVSDRGRAEDELRALVERVSWRARKRGLLARTVTLKLRYADFTTLTRARSGPPTHAEADVLATARALLREAWRRRAPIRLLGVALSGLVAPPPQLALPFGSARPGPAAAIDAVRERFGYQAIRLGRVAGSQRRAP